MRIREDLVTGRTGLTTDIHLVSETIPLHPYAADVPVGRSVPEQFGRQLVRERSIGWLKPLAISLDDTLPQGSEASRRRRSRLGGKRDERCEDENEERESWAARCHRARPIGVTGCRPGSSYRVSLFRKRKYPQEYDTGVARSGSPRTDCLVRSLYFLRHLRRCRWRRRDRQAGRLLRELRRRLTERETERPTPRP